MAKVRVVWRRITRALSREGEETQVCRFFFKAVVHSVLIFGTEIWVVTPAWERSWGGVPGPSGVVIYMTAPTVAVRQEVGLHLIRYGKGGGGF